MAFKTTLFYTGYEFLEKEEAQQVLGSRIRRAEEERTLEYSTALGLLGDDTVDGSGDI